MPNPLDAAYERATKRYKSPGFRGAYMNGARAAKLKQPADTCPYPPTSNTRSWGAVYRTAWLDGYFSMDKRRRSERG